MNLKNDSVGSQFNDWFALLKSLNWADDADYGENARRSFLEAMRHGISRSRAFFEVANKTDRAGKPIIWSCLHEFWQQAWSEWAGSKSGKIVPGAKHATPPVPAQAKYPPTGNNGVAQSPLQSRIANLVVIDGTNVIFGSSSDRTASLVNLLMLVRELQKRHHVVKCFFDANTVHKLTDAGMDEEAMAYQQICREFSSMFIEVPGGNRADDFLLAYAHSQAAPVFSNDRFRDYWKKYSWLESDRERRASVLGHSGAIHVIQFNIQVDLPTSLAVAMSLMRLEFLKSPRTA